MCDKITKLAKQNKFQWLGICAHGSAHIFWRTIHMSFTFEMLETLMKQALLGKLPVECYGTEYLLWLDQVALKLTEKGYFEIQNLFASAAETQLKPMIQLNKEVEPENHVLH